MDVVLCWCEVPFLIYKNTINLIFVALFVCVQSAATIRIYRYCGTWYQGTKSHPVRGHFLRSLVESLLHIQV